MMERLQEDREDARQQRLLEHESRMEQRRQSWEEQRRVREEEDRQEGMSEGRGRDLRLVNHKRDQNSPYWDYQREVYWQDQGGNVVAFYI